MEQPKYKIGEKLYVYLGRKRQEIEFVSRVINGIKKLTYTYEYTVEDSSRRYRQDELFKTRLDVLNAMLEENQIEQKKIIQAYIKAEELNI